MITPCELQPTYSIKRFTDEIYSVVRFKRSDYISFHHNEELPQVNDEKLDNAFSRARSMVMQYGLCNPWDWFATLTLDPTKYNRYDLETFKKDLSQFMRDMRKRYSKCSCVDGKRLSFVFVPENHKDGAWHIHGLIYGLPSCAVKPFERGKHPNYLVNNGFYNWPDYQEKFGFVSLGRVRDQIGTVLYTTKYINKDVESLRDLKGQHLYMASRPLQSANNIVDVYGSVPELDKTLTAHYQFCSTGLVTGASWYWPMQFAQDYEMLPRREYVDPPKPTVEFRPESVDPTCQMQIDELY